MPKSDNSSWSINGLLSAMTKPLKKPRKIDTYANTIPDVGEPSKEEYEAFNRDFMREFRLETSDIKSPQDVRDVLKNRFNVVNVNEISDNTIHLFVKNFVQTKLLGLDGEIKDFCTSNDLNLVLSDKMSKTEITVDAGEITVSKKIVIDKDATIKNSVSLREPIKEYVRRDFSLIDQVNINLEVKFDSSNSEQLRISKYETTLPRSIIPDSLAKTQVKNYNGALTEFKEEITNIAQFLKNNQDEISSTVNKELQDEIGQFLQRMPFYLTFDFLSGFEHLQKIAGGIEVKESQNILTNTPAKTFHEAFQNIVERKNKLDYLENASLLSNPGEKLKGNDEVVSSSFTP